MTQSRGAAEQIAKAAKNGKTVAKTNERLRQNCGIPNWIIGTFVTPGGFARHIVALLFWIHTPLVYLVWLLMDIIPAKFKHMVCGFAWRCWLRLHKALPRRFVCHGMSDSMSIEGHALHNVMWPCRMFPNPSWQMRFALKNLGNFSHVPTAKTVEWVETSPGLRSAYVHLTSPAESNPRVIFWVFGGAYLSGDVKGNMGLAEHYARELGCDAFVVDMRLCPEVCVMDMVLDMYRGYEWLLKKVPAENIIMLGISSGGGTVVRALQLALSDDATRRDYFGEKLDTLPPSLPAPAGAILLGPFVNYDTDNLTDSMLNYQVYDWVVSQSVAATVIGYGYRLCGGKENWKKCSPLMHSMEGLCPLMISVSEHECLIDETRQLAAKATKDGVDVTLSTQPYLCHVYQVITQCLPEARAEELRILDWVRSRGGAWA